MNRVQLIGGAAIALLSLVPAQGAEAGSISYTLNTVFNNGPSPTSSSPWLTAEFTDVDSNNDTVFDYVALTLTASLEVASEFIDEVTFNVKPGVTPSSVTVTNTTLGNPIVTSIVGTTQNAQNLTGGGNDGKGFDFKISWETSNSQGGVKRFNGVDVESFTFALTGLLSSDFDYTNTGGANAHMAAHVQGIPGSTGSQSTAIKDGDSPFTVPDGGSTMTLLGSALLAVGMLRRRLS